MSIAFLAISIIIVATPGIGALYTVSAGLSRGARAGVVAAFGCTLGTVPHLGAAITGTAALLRIISSAVLANLLNPKLTIFFFAFLPQFVPSDAPHPLATMLSLSAVFMLITFVVFALYGTFAAAVRHHLASRPRLIIRMRRVFAVSFVALGARLATTAR